MRNCDCHNLRFECWKWRKTHGLELDLFAFEEPLAQITQRDCESESGKCSTHLDIDPFGYILVIFADVRTGDSQLKIGCEFALRRSMVEFFPRPLFLHEIGSLPKARLFFKQLTIWKFVSNDHIEPMVFDPLPELSVGQFFSVDVTKSWITVRRAC